MFNEMFYRVLSGLPPRESTVALIGLVVGLLISSLFYVVLRIFKKGHGGSLASSCVVLLISFIVIASFFSASMIVKIESQSMIVSDEEEIVEIFPEAVALWSWNKRLSGLKKGQLISYKTDYFTVSMSGPHSVTLNPKVRDLDYRVHLETLGSPEEYIQLQKTKKKWEYTPELAKYWLYEFNEKYSKELAQFYNPIDENQQKMFNHMVKVFLNEKLKGSGLRFEVAWFYVS